MGSGKVVSETAGVQEEGAMQKSEDCLSVWERCVKDSVNELQLLIPDTARKRILGVRNGHKWTLPQCFGENMNSWEAPLMLNEAKSKLGFDFSISILRWIWTRNKKPIEPWGTRSVIIFETHEDSNALPHDWEWVDIEEADIEHCEDEARDAIREELKSIWHGREPELRVAWGRVGWFNEKAKWMCNVLRSHGLEVTEPVVQLKCTILCSILRVNTNKGFYFLKCSPALCNEAAITSVMCKFTPSFVAKPLFIDIEERITITADHGKEWGLLERSIENSELPQFFRDTAKFQKASLLAISELKAAGMMVLSTEWMEENLDFFLEHEEVEFLKDCKKFNYIKRWKASIVRALRDVGKAKLPTTFVHGDLGTGNVFRPGGGRGSFCFFDWNQSHIGCCLFDFHPLCSQKLLSDYYEELGIAATKIDEISESVSVAEALSRAFVVLKELIHVEKQAKSNCQDTLQVELWFIHWTVKKFIEKSEKAPKHCSERT